MVLITTFLFQSCTNKSGNQNAQTPIQSTTEDKPDDELAIIEQSGRSFYDWYFKNDFPNIDVIKDKNGKCKLDTLSYFKELRTLGTISEKFISKEKERTYVCSEFISTIDYSEYQESEAYDYDKYCNDFYHYYWLKSQEYPDELSTKNIKRNNDSQASVDIYKIYKHEGANDSPLSTVFLEKEQGIWKIVEIKFINREENKTEKVNIYGQRWYGGIVRLDVGETSLNYWYHGQCIYFYPVKKISNTVFEMIWARDMDCRFDNGTDETFGVKKTPEIGKPFAKYTLKNNILYAEYYYKEWVEKYNEQIEGVFVDKYFLRNEDY